VQSAPDRRRPSGELDSHVASSRAKRLHLIVGMATVAAFLATGLYMHFALGHLSELEDFPRALYRSGHIYLLYAGLLNLAIGTYLTAARSQMRRNLQGVGSGLLLVTPVLFLYGFAMETPLGMLERTWTQWSIFASTAGIILHALSRGLECCKHSGRNTSYLGTGQ
jgi:hypothetical protein